MAIPFRYFHFLGWFIFYFIALDTCADLIGLLYNGECKWWWESINSIFFSGLLVFLIDSLVVYSVLYRWYRPFGFVRTFLIILCLIPFFIGLRFLVEEIIFPMLIAKRNYAEGTKFSYYLIDNIYYTVLYISYGVLYYFIQVHKFNDQYTKSLQELNKKAELDFLKSQINPHFLFNNFNSIYSLVYQKSDKAIPAMDRMNALLRYGLYEKEPMVAVQMEIEYLLNYIELQRLRYDYPLQTDLQLQNIDETIRIPTLSLIPFVENAFKHGIFKSPNDILVVNLNQVGNHLIFRVSNSINKGTKDSTGGVGLANVRRRLELIYGKKHTLKIEEKASRFNVELEIEI